MGYTRLRHYPGGMAEWAESGAPVEKDSDSSSDDGHRPPLQTRASSVVERVVNFLGSTSFNSLLGMWLGLVLGCGILYWIADLIRPMSLMERGGEMGGLASAIYFSFVTATSVGFGDVIPLGWIRVLAIAEAAAGLIIFGCVISKLVSRRQEILIEETHRIAFDESLGRVRMNLHLLLAEFQAISEACDSKRLSEKRILARVESATALFVAELRVIHRLLYRVENIPEDVVLEALLTELAADLQEIVEILPETQLALRAPSLDVNLRRIRELAGEICSGCVPRQYAEVLRVKMDAIQQLARLL